MKLPGTICSIFVLIVLTCSTSGQGFVNLDFESATLVPVGAGSPYVQFGQAFPGWTVTLLDPLSTNALYDNMNLDSVGISIVDANNQSLASEVIDGLYTALLQSGLGYSSTGAVVSDITLSQTGAVPDGTQSLRFKAKPLFDASGKFAVTLGGQTLSLTSLGNGTNYSLYGANVSQWAGQTAQLSFTVFAEKPHVNDEGLLLDDIEFSPEAIPVAQPIVLSASISGPNMAISWTPLGGTLEWSPAVGSGATWSTIGTQNPTNIPVASGARFFRISP